MTSAGYSVQSASDLDSALSKAAASGQDLLICDALAPGLEALCGREPGGPAVLLYSGLFTKEEGAALAEAAGASAFIPSGADSTALSETLLAAISATAWPAVAPAGNGGASAVLELMRRKTVELGLARNVLLENSVRTDGMLAAMVDVIFVLDGDGRFLDIARTDQKYLYRPPGELLGRTMYDVFTRQQADSFMRSVHSALADGHMVETEYPLVMNGLELWFEAKLAPTPGGHVVVVTRDITRRKTAEDSLKAGLAEKEMLLREIHHRVKNNLQVVLSLLSMHSRKVSDPSALAAFRESRARIRAMGLVHESLCRSADVARINVRDYAGALTRDIISAFGRTQDVVCDCHVCDRAVPADIAMPLGLILNELVSNSLKHAFADGRPGRVLVMMVSEPGGCRLEVEDNGPGLPPDYDLRKAKSLGMQLVASLAGQISGTVGPEPSQGARILVRFPG